MPGRMPQSEPTGWLCRLAAMHDIDTHRSPAHLDGGRAPLVTALLLGVAFAYGCVATGAGGRPSPSAPPSPSAQPSPSASVTPSITVRPSPSPSAHPSPRPSPQPSPSAAPVESISRAVALVLASDARFAGIGQLQPGTIGQAAWYEASAADDGFVVNVRIGWGDCPSGCIEEHRWRYTVDRAGRISLRDESGEPVPAGVRPPAVEGDGRLRIKLVAGPTCPVETIPPQPDCDPAKVADAIVVVRDSQGRVVAEPASDQEGTIILTLPAGAYVLEPSVVEDYLGQAEPVIVWVLPGTPAAVTLAYDTGIR